MDPIISTLLADHTLLHTLGEWLPLLGIFMLGAGFLAGSWRRGRGDAAQNAIDLAESEAHVLQGRADRLEKDLASVREKSAADVARLEGVVEQLRAENEQLRKLVMLEKVPPAMAKLTEANTQHAMELAAQQRAAEMAALLAEISEMLHPIAQGVVRLLTERENRDI